MRGIQSLTNTSLSCCLFPGPPLVILEFVPHGDLLGYLKKSRGENDNYYNLTTKSMPCKITEQQLYQFAYDIACGMEFLSAHQVSCLVCETPIVYLVLQLLVFIWKRTDTTDVCGKTYYSWSVS